MTALFNWVPEFIARLFDTVTGWVSSLLPDWLGRGFAEISQLLGPELLYFVHVFGLDVVPPVILGAYAARFLIRRIPVVG